MKRNVVLGLAAIGAVAMLCGFDSAETADTVIDKMNEASASATTMTATMDMNLDASINIGDGTNTSTLAATATGSFDIAAAMDPVAMEMSGSMKVSALGQGQEMTMKSYAVTNDQGGLDMYTYSQESADTEGVWSYQANNDFNLTELQKMSNTLSAADLADWGLTFTLAPEAATVNGAECYALSTTIDSSSLNTMISKISELSGQDLSSDADVALAMGYLEGLKMNMTYYVDTTSYLPVSLHVDMNDSDLTVLNSLLATSMGSSMGEGTTVELVLNDFSIDMNTKYGEAVSVTVPQEALDAVASGAAVSVDSMVTDLENTIETEIETEAAAN